MIIIIKLLTILIGSILFYKMIYSYIKRNNVNSIIYPTAVYYFFFYIPLIFDIFIGHPSYRNFFTGFIISGQDFLSELIYCIIVTYIFIVFYNFQKKNFYSINLKSNYFYSDIFFGIFLIILSIYCIPLLVNSDLMSVVLNYNMFNTVNPEITKYRGDGIIIIGLILLMLFFENNKVKFIIKFIILIPFILFALSLDGKRAIVFIFFAGILFIILNNKIINKISTYCFLIPLSILMVFAFSSQYQEHFERNLTNDTFYESYSSYRINYARDDTLQMVIYSEIYDEMKILDNRGESFLFYLTFYIQREFWTEKPYPFAVYFTNALLGIYPPRELGWGMTTSIFDEILANFGFFGILFSPFLIVVICKIGMKLSNGILGNIIFILSIFISVMLLVVEITAYLKLYLVFGVCIILYIINKKVSLKSKAKVIKL